MHVELQSATDWAMHAVFDPRAVLHHLNNPALEHVDEKVLGPDLDQGNILLYSNSSDGGISVCVCVDETPPGTWLEHADMCIQDGLLRVPSGVVGLPARAGVSADEGGGGILCGYFNTMCSIVEYMQTGEDIHASTN